MGTVCYAPDIPVFERHINPYSGLEFPGKEILPKNLNNSLVMKITEDYKTPQIITPPMNPTHLNQLRVSNSAQMVNPPQQSVTITTITTPPVIPVGVSQDTNAIFKQLNSSPEALVHGPPPELASPCSFPSVTESIMERRKKLKMFKFEGQTRGVPLGPFQYHADGVIYIGQWQNGTPHGKGMIYFTDGSVFQGGFFEGKSIGKGRLISRNGDYYEGDVSANVATGMGVSENNVIRYQGQFQNNLPHGQGVEISLDGRSRFVGTFYEGTKVSGVLTWGDNGEFVYEGRFANNTFNGRGVLRAPSGTYFGDFVNGHKQGSGQMYGADGTLVFRGNWINDAPEGSAQQYPPQQYAPQANWGQQ